MSLWRLEWIRLIRTKRWLALLGVYVFFGLVGPLSAAYLPEIIERFGGDIEVIVPDPVAADGIAAYVSNVSQIGLLIALWVAAAALVFDSPPQMGIFLRTRVKRMSQILVPRYVVATAAVATAFVAGSIAAVYESVVLMGSLPVGGWLLGTLLGCVYLAFAVALVAAITGGIRSVAGAMVAAIAVLLALPIVGVAEPVGRWLPSHLVGAMDALVRGASIADYLPAALVSLLAAGACLAVGVRAAGRRQL